MNTARRLERSSKSDNPAPYDVRFFAERDVGALRSARVVIPIILEYSAARSVLDVGCGTGTWLKVFAESGIEDYLGIDGSYIRTEMLKIPYERFRPVDLATGIRLERTFDLAVCLEVAEHLPRRAAAHLIKLLTEAAPVVLFSAAIPGQGGVNHINERWPGYWEDLFKKFDYQRIDLIRPRIWRDPQVEFWYRQNIFVYASASRIASTPAFQTELTLMRQLQMELISRQYFDFMLSLRGILRNAPHALWDAIRRRF